MDLQALAWFGAAIVACLTIYNTVMTAGHKRGATDVQLNQLEANEKAWNIRFDALHNAFALHQSHVAERFEKVVERLNDALLTMAREHPTKGDLQQVKTEILERIDSQYGPPTRRRAKAQD